MSAYTDYVYAISVTCTGGKRKPIRLNTRRSDALAQSKRQRQCVPKTWPPERWKIRYATDVVLLAECRSNMHTIEAQQELVAQGKEGGLKALDRQREMRTRL